MTARSSAVPARRKTVARFRMTCRACSTTPPGTKAPVAGSTGSWPVTNRNSPARTAWLYAAVGGGGGPGADAPAPVEPPREQEPQRDEEPAEPARRPAVGLAVAPARHEIFRQRPEVGQGLE